MGCRRERRDRDSTFAEASQDYVVGGDRVDGAVDVPDVAQNHLAVAATTVSRRHQVIAVAQPRHVAAARRRVALTVISRSETHLPLRHHGGRVRVPDLVLAVLHPRAQERPREVPLHLLQLDLVHLQRRDLLRAVHVPDAAGPVARRKGRDGPYLDPVAMMPFATGLYSMVTIFRR